MKMFLRDDNKIILTEHYLPALTKGGSKPAEIAVPTNALPPVAVRETPKTVPAAAETIIDMIKLNPCPSGIMALLGHLYVSPANE